MNMLAKTVIMTSVVSLLSACQLTTAPQSTTYWVKQGTTDYQSHKERIRTHDKLMECRKEVSDRLDEYDQTPEQTDELVADCMVANHYQLYKNWYDIKETKK